MQRDILRQLLQAHTDRDDAAFRSAALKLASSEQKARHYKTAKAIRAHIEDLDEQRVSTGQQVVDIGRPRKELASLLQGGHRDERLRDIVLTPTALSQVERCLLETRRRGELATWAMEPRRKLLFYGPPGCGKTLAARVIAGELGLSLFTLQFEGFFSRFLGETASHVGVIFSEMIRRPAVYFFDEFDALAKSRADGSDVGEIRRVVVSFLQLLDSDESPSLIIAATNFEGSLDHAVFRRFDEIIHFPIPNREEIARLVALRLKNFGVGEELWTAMASEAVRMSYADVARACDDAIKTMVLAGRRSVTDEDLLLAIRNTAARIGLGQNGK